MKRDIRDLFKVGDLVNKTLPDNHRVDFLEKLKEGNAEKVRPKTMLIVYKIAASILLFVSLGYFVSKEFNTESTTERSKLVEQIEIVEKQYLENINKEWQSFLILAKDEKLIKRYRKRLDDLDKDYQEISEQYKKDANDFLVLEALVENLQTRLQLLKDIQEHITLLNLHNRQNENTTI